MGTSAGGAYSTVGDLRRFFAALSTGRLLKPETARLLSTQQIVAAPARGDRPELGYGLGFGASRFEAHRWFGHNGGAPGVNAETMVFPDDDATLIVLSNRDPPMAARLLQAGREVMFTGRCEGIVTAR